MPPPIPIPPPPTYTPLNLPQITLSHHPTHAPTPTPIIILTLSRPEKRNAFTDTMMTSLITAFDLLSRDERVKCVVLTGAGGVFCAGADLEIGFGGGQGGRELGSGSGSEDWEGGEGGKGDGEGGEEQERYTETNRDGGGKVTLAILGCNKPVIAAINGHAIGVGITMTLGCAIRIVSQKAKIGFVFGRRGIVMEGCSSYLLPRLIGLAKSLHLITTGAVYPSTHPLLSELFSEVVEEKQVLGRALEVAEEVVRNTSTVSWTLMRDMMIHGPGTVEAAHGLESRVLWELYKGRDVKEGVDAFLGKRDAVFKGTMERDAPGIWPWWGEGKEGREGKGKGKGKGKEGSKL